MGALTPLALKLVYLRELAHLNPLIPSHYWRLCKQVYRALNENQGKVSTLSPAGPACSVRLMILSDHSPGH